MKVVMFTKPNATEIDAVRVQYNPWLISEREHNATLGLYSPCQTLQVS